jgi:hypothetical protein
MKTAVIEIRCDLRDLATCASYYVKNKVPIGSKSSLGSMVVSDFAQAAMNQGAKAFASTSDALMYMSGLGLGPVNRVKDKGGKRANSLVLSKAIKIEEDIEGAGNYIDPREATKEDWLAVAKKTVEEMRNK